jgi:hypothetical protein
MIPIHLEWRRPVDGVDLIEDESAGEEGMLLARSDRFEPIAFRSHNLEDPLCLRLVNCQSTEDDLKFISRFGFPDTRYARDGRYFAGLVRSLKEDLDELLWLTTADDPAQRGRLANELLKDTALHPSFEYSEATGRNSLVIRASSLADLMSMEACFALEAGAVMTRCAHCNKSYLTGPLTGRRSHSVYCSDRCRVAAMRARNAEKGNS